MNAICDENSVLRTQKFIYCPKMLQLNITAYNMISII